MPASLSAHARPPDALRQVYKEYQNMKTHAIDQHATLIQFDVSSARQTCSELSPHLRRVFHDFLASGGGGGGGGGGSGGGDGDASSPSDITLHTHVYHVEHMPGLLVYPSLLPPEVQLQLLDKSLHRDVSNPLHQTNVHLFHDVPYPERGHDNAPKSFFDPSAEDITFRPLDASVHKPFSVRQFWNKKFRWATLGGQYDWTKKAYPSEAPPAFPADTKQLIEDIFPMKAEAAILNLYSPGDTLSLHRDVSEECNQPLVSISMGCDAVFIVGLDGGEPSTQPRVASIRLRSGDAVLMSGESRYAWHGVPKILEGTCPAWLQDWPAGHRESQYNEWKGWMNSKRINLNVRQMFE